MHLLWLFLVVEVAVAVAVVSSARVVRDPSEWPVVAVMAATV